MSAYQNMRECEEYNTRKGNNSAQSLMSFQLPLLMRSEKPYWWRSLTLINEAFMTAIFSIKDLNTTINHEPRVHDLLLATKLEMQNTHSIRRLIEEHKDALEKLGEVVSHLDAKPQGGRPSQSYYLTKKQALYICTKARTEKASEITIALVEVYDAFTSDKPKPVIKQSASSINVPLIVARLDRSIMAVNEIKTHFCKGADALWSHAVNLSGELENITDLLGEPRRMIAAQMVSAKQAELLRGERKLARAA